jgi:diguanylate cyclase (GGDEF)-like protein/PAS domain S-box-containing protein
MEKPSILIVEDDSIISLDIREKLKHWGYNIASVFKTAEEAVSSIESLKPDLIIMDINLAGEMDGIEAATLIKNNYHVPVIYLTAYSDNTTLSRILESESYGYIHKPIDDSVMKFTIELALYKYKMDVRLKESEEVFRLTFESAVDAIIWINFETGIISNCNAAAERLLDKKRDTIIGIHHNTLFPPDNAEYYENSLRKYLSRNDAGDIEAEIVTQQGIIKNVAISATITTIRETRIINGIFHDITDRINAEKALKLSEEKYRMHFENASEVIYSFDPEYNLISVSPSVERLLGYRPEELVGKKVTELDILDKAYFSIAYHDTKRVISGENIDSSIYKFISKDGRIIFGEVSSAPMIQGGKIIGSVSIARDITARKFAEEQLQYRDDFEKLISGMSAEFINLPTEKIDISINEALKRIAAFIDVPSAVVYLFDREKNHLINTHQWHNENNPAHMPEYHIISPEIFSYYWKTLQRLESIVLSKQDDLPPAAEKEHAIVRSHGFRPIIFVPMIQRGILFGTLGFYGSLDEPKEWSTELVMLFKFIADIFVSALERKQAEKDLLEREARYRTLIEQSPIAIEIYSPDGTLRQVNKAWESLWRSNPHEAINKFNFFKDKQLESLGLVSQFKSALNGESISIPEFEFNPSNSGYTGRKRLLSSKIYPIKDKENNVQNIVITHEDITEKKMAEDQAMFFSMYDQLTELPNKEMFLNRLRMEIVKTQRRNKDTIFAVLCLGIDKFKNINDIHGPKAGDRILKIIAAKLKKSFRHDDIVSRFDGDKFMVLFTDISSTDEVINVVDKTLKVFVEYLDEDNNKIKLSSSIGVSIFPNDGTEADTLVKNSESAMYMAKQQGPGSYKLFDHQMHAAIINNIKLESELLSALYHDEFIAYYQPKYVKDCTINGMECLIRWKSPHRGLVPPFEFIPVAEKNGLIVDIGYYILRKACQETKAWQQKGYKPLRVAVNLSPFQFSQPDLVDNIEKILVETGLDPAWLEMEITESGIMQNESESIMRLGEINKLGIKISIDDFGTGYSSLSKLKTYPIDSLKIDKSFIDDIPGDSVSQDIVISIIELAHNLGYTVVAEGVEKKEQLDFLIQYNCDEFQGYYFSKPIPPDEFEKIITMKN